MFFLSFGSPEELTAHKNMFFVQCFFFPQSWIKEHFVCVDQDRVLYHFLVEGTVIKDGSKVQCDVCYSIIYGKKTFRLQ